jgi:hypothetical protein
MKWTKCVGTSLAIGAVFLYATQKIARPKVAAYFTLALFPVTMLLAPKYLVSCRDETTGIENAEGDNVPESPGVHVPPLSTSRKVVAYSGKAMGWSIICPMLGIVFSAFIPSHQDFLDGAVHLFPVVCGILLGSVVSLWFTVRSFANRELGRFQALATLVFAPVLLFFAAAFLFAARR